MPALLTITREPTAVQSRATVDEFAAFAALRACVCGAVMDPDDLACPTCERVPIAVPAPSAWPVDLWRHQQVLLVERAVARFRTADGGVSDAGKRFTLMNNYRGVWVGEGARRVLVPYFGATLDQVFPIALARATAWAAARGAK